MKRYVMSFHQKHFIEAFLLSIHNMLLWRNKKNVYVLLSRAMLNMLWAEQNDRQKQLNV